MRNKTLATILAATLILTAVLLAGCGEYDYDLSKYVSPGKYEGVEVSASEIDAELDSTVSSFLEGNASETEVTDRAAKDGDTVNIDYAGTMNGEAFEGGTDEGSDLKLGSGQFIEGFESGLVGKKTGDEVTLKLKFPEDYGTAEYAGKDVEFKVKINKITETIVPELTDALVTEKTSYATVAEYKTAKREIIKQNMVWAKIKEASEVKQYPKKEVKSYYDRMIDNYTKTAATYQLGLETYVGYFFGADMDSFAAMIVEQAKSYAVNDMLALVISGEKSITLTDAEYKRLSETFAKESGFENVKALEKTSGKSTVKKNALTQLVVEWVAARAVETPAAEAK